MGNALGKFCPLLIRRGPPAGGVRCIHRRRRKKVAFSQKYDMI
jgi:hypothetical protein